MGNKILHVGELGNAKLVKNAMAMFAAVTHLTLAEICSWLKKGGLSEDTFRTILKNSAQDSVAIDRIMEIVVSRKYKPRKSWMPKDVGFGFDMAREMEVPMPFVALGISDVFDRSGDWPWTATKRPASPAMFTM